MRLTTRIKRLLLPFLLGLALLAPAQAQGNSFDLGDILGIGRNDGYYYPGGNNSGINTQAIMGIANILYQISQRDRYDDSGYYPNGYPNGYPNPGYYPNGYPNGYPNPGYYPNGYPNGYPNPGYYPNGYPNGYPNPGYYPNGNPNQYPYQY
jgi:hypothetical protein